MRRRLVAGNRFPDALPGVVPTLLAIVGLVLALALAEAVGTALDSAGAAAVEPAHPAPCPAASPAVRDPVDPLEPREARRAAPAPAIAPSVRTFDHRALTPLRPSLERVKEASGLAITGSRATGTLATAPAGGFELDGALCMVPLQTTPAETPATIVNGDAALHANTAPDTDTIVRPTASGVTVVESRRDAHAPTSFSWRLGLAPGYELRALENGGVAIEDPSRAAPETRKTPREPAKAQRTDAIPDAGTQLAESRYEIARAQHETGHRVVGVVTASLARDSDGDSAPAELRTSEDATLTASSPPDSEAVVVTVAAKRRKHRRPEPPQAVPSYPLIGIPANLSAEAANAGCSFAAGQPPEHRLMLLNFGQARVEAGEFGAGRRPFYSNSDILTALQAAAEGYRQPDCHLPGTSATIAYGVGNFKLSTTGNDGLPMTPELAEQVGAAQLQVARDLRQSLSGEDDAAVAGDIEPGWDQSLAGVEVGKALVRGAATGDLTYFNFGTAGHCPPYTGFAPGCGSWRWKDLGEISQQDQAVPLPEIYHEYQANQWNRVRKRWNRRRVRKPNRCNRRHKPRCYSFAGATSEPKPCGASLSASQSWKKLWKANPEGSVERELIFYNPGLLNC
jgi:hypothetical protein